MKSVTKTISNYVSNTINAMKRNFSTGMVNYDSPENRVYRKLSRTEERVLLSEQKRTSGILNFAGETDIVAFV